VTGWPTIFPRQGDYALGAQIERIGELADLDLPPLFERPADPAHVTLEMP